MLPSNGFWIAFRLGGLRYARVPATAQAWAGGGLPGSGTSAAPGVEWLAIPAPDGAFRPVQAVPAARGYFYLVDAASSRLCLYDTAAGLISTFPLPERFTPFSSGRTAVFRGSDNSFVFADYAAGEAWQFTDREGAQGAPAWTLRARVKMPLGWRDCVQQPGSEELSCRSGTNALRFDGALNRLTGSRAASATSRLYWDAPAREWVLEGLSVPDRAALFRFRPGRRMIDSP